MTIALVVTAITTAAAATTETETKTLDTGATWFSEHNPWASTGEAPPPPRPYKLPLYDSSSNADQHTQTRPLKLAPHVDAEGIHRAVLSCYPEKSKFNIDIELEGAYRNRSAYDLTGTSYGQHYIGVVARMPLYSATELSRERDREHSRRTDTAKTVGDLMAALAKRNHAIRELGLYSSLEARSQVRVAQGVAEVAEQVTYLEKTADAQASLIAAESALIEHRLTLISMCDDRSAQTINAYIKRLTGAK